MERQTTIRELKGIGDKTAALFARLNIYTIDDLLLHYPVGYDRFFTGSGCESAGGGTGVCLPGTAAGQHCGQKNEDSYRIHMQGI